MYTKGKKRLGTGISGHKESLSTTETEGLSSSVEPTATVMTSEQPSSNPYETPISDWQERMNQPLDDSAYFPADTDSFMLTSTSGSNNEENKYEKISSYSSAFNENKNAKYHISEENDKGESEPVVVVTKVVASTYGFEIGEDNNDNDDMQERIAQEQETSFGIPTEITNIVNNPLAGLSMDPTNPPTPARLRRVSFDLDISDKDEKSSSRSRRDESIGGSIQCRNSKCAKTATGLEARREFKTCHNCNAYYCCRECRRIHWEKHKKVCMQSRVGQLCKQIIGHVKEDSFVVSQLSTVAKRGFLAKGRGCVKLFFSSPDRAERFLTGGLPELPEPWYIPHSDMLPEEMGAPTFSELSENCRSYNPDTRFVLYASVCVVNEVPTSGAVKWEREMISRSAKIRLLIPRSYDETQPHHHAANPAHLNAEDIDIQTFSPAFTSADDESTIENSTENETLILRSVPTPASLKLNSNDDRRRREVSFTNIQKHLIERGVDLRRTYPDIYSKLCNYVENDEPFLPVTIYPRNSSTGCQFMCVIMPESSDTTDGFSSDPSRKVETINISEH